jgi:DNA-binding MarR family transcriptional regulator
MSSGRRSPPAPSTPEERVLRAFKEFRAVVLRDPMRQTIKFLHGRNMSFASIATVMALRERGDQTISALAHEIGLSVAATSQLVERLVQDELVRRTEHPSDRRRKQVALTAKGNAFLAKMDASHFAAAATVLSRAPVPALKRLEVALAEVTSKLSREPE